MGTTAALIESARTHLISTGREELNRLSASVDASTTSFPVSFDAAGVARGTVLSVDLELAYVWSVAAATITVQRGFAASTAATHVDESIIYVGPTFSAFTIFSAINDELMGLSSPSVGLFQTATNVLTYNGSIDGYDLDAPGMIGDVLEVRYETDETAKRWPRVDSWTVYRNADTTDFPSGTGLVLNQMGQSGLDLRITYAAGFDPLTALTEDVATITGLPDTALDILAMGAAIRLVSGREIRRNRIDAQGDTRRAEEVPVGAVSQSTRELRRIYDARISQERTRLRAQWPTRLKYATTPTRALL